MPVHTTINYKALKLPEPHDLGIFRGDDRDIIFDIDDGDGSSVNITGATITFRVRNEVGGTQVFVKTVGSGITISTDPNNRFTVAVDPADISSTQAPGNYRYDVQLSLSGYVVTVAWGKFIILGEVA